MKKSEFIAELATVINEAPEKLTPGAKMESFQGWDSTAVLGVIAILEGSVGIEVQPESVAECKTVQDVMNLAKGKLE